jgi:1,4-dihydroxy-2-naphthoyl-CoA synthase
MDMTDKVIPHKDLEKVALKWAEIIHSKSPTAIPISSVILLKNTEHSLTSKQTATLTMFLVAGPSKVIHLM